MYEAWKYIQIYTHHISDTESILPPLQPPLFHLSILLSIAEKPMPVLFSAIFLPVDVI